MAALQQLLDALRAARASREVSSILLLIGKAVESLLEGLVHGLQVRGCCGHPSFGELPPIRIVLHPYLRVAANPDCFTYVLESGCQSGLFYIRT
jgi:hypothetical protein